VDAALRDYLRSRLKDIGQAQPETEASPSSTKSNVIPFRRVTQEERARGIPCAPCVDLRFAAGVFSGTQISDEALNWVALPDFVSTQPGMFVAQVVGESMNLRIPSGAWCLFRANPQGTRSGKIVVVQHREIDDPETGGSYTIKRYLSEKIPEGDDSCRRAIGPNSARLF
jgi:hypothetical protein